MSKFIPIQRAPVSDMHTYTPWPHTHTHTHTHTHIFLKIIVYILHWERLCISYKVTVRAECRRMLSLLSSVCSSPHFISYWLSVITSSSGSTAFALLVILERCVTWMWTSVKFHLAYTRASVSTRPGASSASVALDTQVALLPSGDTKINMRV